MDNQVTIHQYTLSMAYGDGISRGVILIKQMLNELGCTSSNIYTSQKCSAIELKEEYHHHTTYKDNNDNILLCHFSIGHDFHDEIMKFKDKKIIIYHNITPSHFFDGEAYKKMSDLGRRQLRDSSNCFIAAIADSKYNEEELLYYNYKNSIVLPLLVDSREKKKTNLNKKILKKYSSTFNILFVGRIVQNKAQHLLIDVIYELKRREISNVKLFIVGRNHYSDYFNFLFKYAKNLGIEENIIITNAVNENDLYSYYKTADLYLSLSEHEGFGMPILEAINNDLPVLAYNCGSISTTLGKKGLLNYKAANSVAKSVMRIMNNKAYVKELIDYQKKHLKKFEYEYLKNNFKDFLIKNKILKDENE